MHPKYNMEKELVEFAGLEKLIPEHLFGTKILIGRAMRSSGSVMGP